MTPLQVPQGAAPGYQLQLQVPTGPQQQQQQAEQQAQQEAQQKHRKEEAAKVAKAKAEAKAKAKAEADVKRKAKRKAKRERERELKTKRGAAAEAKKRAEAQAKDEAGAEARSKSAVAVTVGMGMGMGMGVGVEEEKEAGHDPANQEDADAGSKGWSLSVPGLGAYECLIALRKVVLLLLPGFHLRAEYSIAQLMLFDSVSREWSEHETLADWAIMAMIIFGMIHLLLLPYKSWAVSEVMETHRAPYDASYTSILIFYCIKNY
jgi:hypothetical protein